MEIRVLPEGIERVLLSRETIEERVRELAARVSEDYAGKEVLVLGILKGAFIFMSDLVRLLPNPVEVDFLAIRTYLGRTRSSVEPHVPEEDWPDLTDRHVLLVEDILDSGRTMSYAARECLRRGAASFRVCTLLAKDGYEKSSFPNPDYVGFEIPQVYVVGYGLDYAERYRNLNFVGVLSREIVAMDRRMCP